MKKKIIGGLAMMAIAAIATLNINLAMTNSNPKSGLTLDAIEAYAFDNEGGGHSGREGKWNHCETTVPDGKGGRKKWDGTKYVCSEGSGFCSPSTCIANPNY